jgi:chemotaxis methyl-accepting protein methylase
VTTAEISPQELHGLLGLVAERRGVDFRDHRPDSLRRGLEARMRASGCADLAAYQRELSSDGELDRLLAALVVPVTSFFRDPAVFAALDTRVLPALRAAAGAPGVVRAWVVGAASGEEAWSLAMLLAQGGRFEVLASDVDARSIELARAASYPAAAAAAVPPALRHHLIARGDQLSPAPELAAQVRFCHHDLMGPLLAPREAVVASFQLISLRNVLIYFDRRLQLKALERLLSVLDPGGALLLGGVESLPDELGHALEPWPGLDPALHIFCLQAGTAVR